MRPRLLFLSPVTPSHSGRGVQRRCAMHIDALSPRFDIDLVIVQNTTSANISSQMYELCRSVSFIQANIPTKGWRRSFPGSFLLHEFFFPEGLFSPIREENLGTLTPTLKGAEFEACFCFRVSMGRIGKRFAQLLNSSVKKWVCDFDDLESTFWRDSITSIGLDGGLEYRLTLKLRARARASLERRLTRLFNIIAVSNDASLKELQGVRSHNTLICLPNCIPDTEIVQKKTHDFFQILFVGTLSYPPNKDGIIWFVNEILPKIDGYPEDVRVSVVGFDPGKEVQSLGAQASVDVIGPVDSTEPYYQEADCVVVPIRAGSGTRIKILEAMSFGVPVISTTIGAEGIVSESGEVALLADEPDEFAQACSLLRRSPAVRTRLSAAAKAFVINAFGIEACYRAFFEVLDYDKSP